HEVAAFTVTFGHSAGKNVTVSGPALGPPPLERGRNCDWLPRIESSLTGTLFSRSLAGAAAIRPKVTAIANALFGRTPIVWILSYDRFAGHALSQRSNQAKASACIGRSNLCGPG